MNVPTTRI